MIKPDGVKRGLIGEIISRFEKKGFNLEAMKIFGFGEVDGIEIKNLSIDKTKIKIGESTYFGLQFINSNKTAKYRLEYTILYLKK